MSIDVGAPPTAGSKVTGSRGTEVPTSVSEGDDLVRLFDQAGDVGRADPLAADAGELLLGRPRGDGATLSDIHGHHVGSGLAEQLAQRWQAGPLRRFEQLGLQELRRVAGEHDSDLVAPFDRAVDGEM